MRIIKRYANRKLYDLQAKRYITLDRVAALIRHGEEVQVLDHKTGEDITALIQSQIIFESEKNGRGAMPGSVLTNLIRTGSERLSHLRETLTPADWRARIDAEIERRIQLLVERGEVAREEGLNLTARLLAAGEGRSPLLGFTDDELERALHQIGVPNRAQVRRLTRRVEALAAVVDRMASHKPAPRKNSHQALKRRVPHVRVAHTRRAARPPATRRESPARRPPPRALLLR